MALPNVATPEIYLMMVVVRDRLEEKRAELNDIIKKGYSTASLRKIWIGDWRPTDGYPAITLEPTGEDFRYDATNYTVGKEFVITVNFYLRTPATEDSIRCISEVGEALHNILNDPKKTAWDVTAEDGSPLGTVWESHASAKGYEYLSEGIRKVSITYTMQYVRIQC
jgi:hypothetical protein